MELSGRGVLDFAGLGGEFEAVLSAGAPGLVSCAKEEAGSTMERKRNVVENGRLD